MVTLGQEVCFRKDHQGKSLGTKKANAATTAKDSYIALQYAFVLALRLLSHGQSDHVPLSVFQADF